MTDVLQPEKLDLDVSWRIGEAAFEYMSRLISDNGFSSLLEFGSGASTVRLAQAFPELSITTFDHDKQFSDQTQQNVEAYGVAERVRVIHAPLKTVWVGSRPFQTYALPPLTGPFDLVLIDGPPNFTRRGREACLYLAYDTLRVGGVVILDDAARPDEHAAVKNWLRVYGGTLDHTYVELAHGLSVLRKTQHLPARKFSWGATVDTYSVLAQQLRFRLATALRPARR